jgi:hypothetical protein
MTMRSGIFLSAVGSLLAVIVISVVIPSGNVLANTCQASSLTCPTSKSVGTSCGCEYHGIMQKGTVVRIPNLQNNHNATAPGCAATPDAKGCR